ESLFAVRHIALLLGIPAVDPLLCDGLVQAGHATILASPATAGAVGLPGAWAAGTVDLPGAWAAGAVGCPSSERPGAWAAGRRGRWSGGTPERRGARRARHVFR